MALTLADRDSSFSMPLYTAQDYQDSREAALDVTPYTGFDSDQAFLTSLEQSGRATMTGVATGLRLSRQSQYSNDPETALAEWYADALALVDGTQGTGYELTRDYRGDSIFGGVEDISVTRRGGEPIQLAWNMTVVRGELFDFIEPPDPVGANPAGDYLVAGEPLDGIREWQVQKSQDISEYRRAFAESPDDNDLLSDGGATRTVTVVGEIARDASGRNAFDATMTDSLGQDETIDVRDALLGVTWTGMLQDYEATDEAGMSRLGEFGLTFVEGEN